MQMSLTSRGANEHQEIGSQCRRRIEFSKIEELEIIEAKID
jgi:hypothetical protein